MPIFLESSIKNILIKMPQTAIDVWCDIEGIDKINKEDFQNSFSDYSSIGLLSLIKSIEISDRDLHLMKKTFSEEEARKIGKAIKMDFNEIDITEFIMGLAVETEHANDTETNVIDNDTNALGKIAWIHLKEDKHYYTKLKRLESTFKKAVTDTASSWTIDALDFLKFKADVNDWFSLNEQECNVSISKAIRVFSVSNPLDMDDVQDVISLLKCNDSFYSTVVSDYIKSYYYLLVSGEDLAKMVMDVLDGYNKEEEIRG